MLARWHAMEPVARGAVLVSAGSMTLVIMAAVVKFLGTRLPSIEILFFRSLIGFLLVMPMFLRNPLQPLRTKRFGMHLLRGATGAVGNACFFWTITHMLLADAMALQFARPLFMIPLALIATILCFFVTEKPLATTLEPDVMPEAISEGSVLITADTEGNHPANTDLRENEPSRR